jgi:SAM-dependent methyltransferase
VAINRADSLDKECIAYIAAHPDCKALDLGCGSGGQSLRMVEAGASVVAIDQFDFRAEFATYDAVRDRLQFMVGDITNVSSLVEGVTFDVAICQRTIHYIPYAQALQFLTDLQTVVTDTLYISVTGSGSLVGDTYPAVGTSLPDRFVKLSALGQEMFSIQEPVCLYSQAEFEQLLTDAGWQVRSCCATAFGNIQAICNSTSQ